MAWGTIYDVGDSFAPWGYHQRPVVMLSDGTLLLHAPQSSTSQRIWYSTDGGQTWASAGDITVTNNLYNYFHMFVDEFDNIFFVYLASGTTDNTVACYTFNGTSISLQHSLTYANASYFPEMGSGIAVNNPDVANTTQLLWVDSSGSNTYWRQVAYNRNTTTFGTKADIFTRATRAGTPNILMLQNTTTHSLQAENPSSPVSWCFKKGSGDNSYEVVQLVWGTNAWAGSGTAYSRTYVDYTTSGANECMTAIYDPTLQEIHAILKDTADITGVQEHRFDVTGTPAWIGSIADTAIDNAFDGAAGDLAVLTTDGNGNRFLWSVEAPNSSTAFGRQADAGSSYAGTAQTASGAMSVQINSTAPVHCWNPVARVSGFAWSEHQTNFQGGQAFEKRMMIDFIAGSVFEGWGIPL